MQCSNVLKIMLLTLLILLVLNANEICAKDATILLKNMKKISGKVVEDVAEYILLSTDFGELKIYRGDIESIFYEEYSKPVSESDILEKDFLNDHVVVHLQDENVVDGILIAKSSTMAMLKTDLGRLTIPKQDIKLLEYVSRAFAERGDPVRVKLTNNVILDGYLYHEDRSVLTVTTKTGRLTIDKEDLRSIEYNVPVRFESPTKKKEEYIATGLEVPVLKRPLLKRQDTFELGYSSQFGEDYAAGAMFVYRNRYSLFNFKTLALNIETNLGVAAFSLNKDVLTRTNIPGAVTATGAAVVSTFGIGFPIHLYPLEGSAYKFFLTPLLQSNLVYKSLKKSYPSFPSLDSEVRATEFKFGLGSRLGLEWGIAKKWNVGLSFDMHFLLKETDFNVVSLHVGTRLY